MKKLMIALAAVAMAAGVQAASAVNWKSGNMFTAEGVLGGWSETAIKENSGLVTMNVYMISATDWADDGIASMSQQELYSYVQSKELSAAYTGKNVNSKGSAINAVNIGTDDLAASTQYYTILTADYVDDSYGKMYMASAQAFLTTAQGEADVSAVFAGDTGSVENWIGSSGPGPDPTPEPTSGLLLLLGVAGLALRRKQK